MESQREDDGRHAEEHHGRESHPAGIGDHIPVAGGRGQQDHGGGHADAAHKDADEGD